MGLKNLKILCLACEKLAKDLKKTTEDIKNLNKVLPGDSFKPSKSKFHK